MKLGILGGGLTGLTLGYLLKQKNIDFEILEKSNECGGLCKSIVEQGFTFDCYGGHVIFSKDEKILGFIKNMLGDNILQNRRNSKIFYKNRYVKYPFENGLSDLPIEENLECLYHFLEVLIKKEKGELNEPKNFKEWIYNTFGKGIAEKYLIPYNRKIWNFPPEMMAVFWIADRLPMPSAEDVIKSSLGIPTEGYLHQLNFYYPKKGGIQSLTKAIEEKIADKIIKNFEVKSIEKEDGRWIISNTNEEKEYNEIISTIPIFDLIKSLEKSLNVPKEVVDAADNLKFNSLITVMIGLDYDNRNDKHWIYFPDDDTLFHRIVLFKNYSPNTVPKGKSSIMAEITYNEGDDVSKMNDDEIIDHVTNALEERKIIDKEKVCFTKVTRTKYAYIIYDLDYKKNMSIINEFLKQIGIKTCGRFAEFRYMNMDACIRSAMDLVEKF